MDKELHVNYWLSSSAHDLEVAETLFQNGKYDWCLYVSHLVIEKLLKAFFVRDTGKPPPRIHNLLRLAENTKLTLTDEQKHLLSDINDFNIEARYPDLKQNFYKLCTKEFVEEYFLKIKELYIWLQLQIKP